MRCGFIGLILGCLAAVAWAGAGEATFYRGTIGKGNGITLKLERLDDGSFQGGYRYDKIGKELWFNSEPAAGGKLKLKEFGEEGKETGKFEGKLDPKAGTFKGTWFAAEGKRQLDFDLKQFARTKKLTKVEDGPAEVSVQYVIFEGNSPFIRSLNSQLRSEAQQLLTQQAKEYGQTKRKDVKEFSDSFLTGIAYTLKVDADVVYLGQDLVSLLYTMTNFTGGAHGNTWHRAQTLTWDGKTLHGLTPSDTIDPSAWGALSKLCADDLRRQGAPDPDGAKFDPRHLPVLNIAAAGLVITFAPYEVGPYAAGSWTVVLPYKAVEPYLKPGTAVAKLAQSGASNPR